MGVLICLRESGLVGMGAMFGGDVIQSRFSSNSIYSSTNTHGYVISTCKNTRINLIEIWENAI